MTIIIENEALQSVLSSHSSQVNRKPSSSLIQDDDDNVGSIQVRKKQCFRPMDSSVLDDDLDSISFIDDECSSVSDTSFSEKSVSFSDDLVTEVRTRERTPKEDVRVLFYSNEDTQRFRQQYRLERKLLAELDVSPDSSVTNEDISALLGHHHTDRSSSSTTLQSSNKRHRISRVVVLHNDKLETFFNPDDNISKEENDDDCIADSVSSNAPVATAPSPSPSSSAPSSSSSTSSNNDDFFDNDSFWSGSITWY